MRLLVALGVLLGLVPNSAHAQSASPSQGDSVLHSALVRIEADMQADGFHPVRVASRVAGRFEGHELHLRGDTVIVIGGSSERAIALADIDSVWVRRDAARSLGFFGAAVCALAGIGLGTMIANDPDSGGGSAVPAIVFGGTLFGAICGAGGWLLGSVIRTWRLEYARPLNSPG